MHKMHAFFVTCITFMLFVSGTSSMYSQLLDVETQIQFIANEIVPDVILDPPASFVQVEYSGGVEVTLGNIVTPSEAEEQPDVTWRACPDALYTLALVDPDAYSRQNPNISEFNHWLLGNIPNNEVKKGEVLASYFPPQPPAGTGLHRYIFLIYKQKERIEFDEPRSFELTFDNRTNFSIYNFSQKYHLEGPIAGNFFFSCAATNSSAS